MSKDGRRRGLSDDERVLWTAFTKAIKPLQRRPAATADDYEAAGVASPPLRKVKSPPLRAAAPSVAPAPALPPPLTPLTRRMKQRVSRGHDAIDGRLDLHGLTQDEAHDALLRFIHQASAREARLVLVITGKSGVLHRQVPHWLALPALRAVVIGFEEAATRHGGAGALYVRVRRRRD